MLLGRSAEVAETLSSSRKKSTVKERGFNPELLPFRPDAALHPPDSSDLTGHSATKAIVSGHVWSLDEIIALLG